ncbi:hypothetical protein AYI68_g5868 [Smittium mucronatum]|uniref:Uncharacterized protein n=1 Tax=Smittium mucronatum TaxID=133383 RepID=A0A1R0GT30_9FUNG|nr:hypothetical protein AYI68_g5868 [Smittium mucronatum]
MSNKAANLAQIQGLTHQQILSLSQSQSLSQLQSQTRNISQPQTHIPPNNLQQGIPQLNTSQNLLSFITSIPDVENLTPQLSIQIFARLNNFQLDSLSVEKKQQLVTLARNGTLRNLILKKKQQILSQLYINQRQNTQQQKTPQQIQAFFQQKSSEQRKANLNQNDSSNSFNNNLGSPPNISLFNSVDSNNRIGPSQNELNFVDSHLLTQKNQVNNNLKESPNSISNNNPNANSITGDKNKDSSLNLSLNSESEVNGQILGKSSAPKDSSNNDLIESSKIISQNESNSSSDLYKSRSSGIDGSTLIAEKNNSNVNKLDGNLSISTNNIIPPSPSSTSAILNSAKANADNLTSPTIHSNLSRNANAIQSKSSNPSHVPIIGNSSISHESNQNLSQEQPNNQAYKSAELTNNQNLLRIAHMAATNTLPSHISSQFSPEYIEKLAQSYKAYTSHLSIQNNRLNGTFKSPSTSKNYSFNSVNSPLPRSENRPSEGVTLTTSSNTSKNLLTPMQSNLTKGLNSTPASINSNFNSPNFNVTQFSHTPVSGGVFPSQGSVPNNSLKNLNLGKHIGDSSIPGSPVGFFNLKNNSSQNNGKQNITAPLDSNNDIVNTSNQATHDPAQSQQIKNIITAGSSNHLPPGNVSSTPISNQPKGSNTFTNLGNNPSALMQGVHMQPGNVNPQLLWEWQKKNQQNANLQKQYLQVQQHLANQKTQQQAHQQQNLQQVQQHVLQQSQQQQALQQAQHQQLIQSQRQQLFQHALQQQAQSQQQKAQLQQIQQQKQQHIQNQQRQMLNLQQEQVLSSSQNLVQPNLDNLSPEQRLLLQHRQQQIQLLMQKKIQDQQQSQGHLSNPQNQQLQQQLQQQQIEQRKQQQQLQLQLQLQLQIRQRQIAEQSKNQGPN